MSCCAPGTEGDTAAEAACLPLDEEIRLASRDIGNGLRQTDLSVPGVHCGACITTIEKGLAGIDGIESARVNLSTKRVTIKWRDGGPVPEFSERLAALGYASNLFDPDADDGDKELGRLLKALAVAGFAASNIMLLSVSVWSGAEGATRDLFHLVSALIAIPALAYSGRLFFSSAWGALKHGRTNMDVPISIGVLLAFGMSLYETLNHGPEAYFDAAVMLLFFLLIGRTLDHVMREKARTAVKGLTRLAARGALVESADGERNWAPVNDIEPGMRIVLAAGERVPVDGEVAAGRSELDCALVSGESAPVAVGPGSTLRAGTLNLTGPLMLTATARADDSFLAEMVRLMEAAEGGKARYRRIADRAAQLYAPVVHLTAFLSFLGWMVADGDWHRALTIAIAVLIITCPCALGLAVPIVQVVAARRLFEKGVMVKDGSAMERLAEADAALFDKTGTLTLGVPQLTNAAEAGEAALAAGAGLAAHSRHPLSRAILGAAKGLGAVAFDTVREEPGQGLEGRIGDDVWRLGRPEWALAEPSKEPSSGTVSRLTRNGAHIAEFRFSDRLRPGAVEAIRALEAAGLPAAIVSGDNEGAVRDVARRLGVQHWFAGMLPAGKTGKIAEAVKAGHKVLMLGDGLNDAPALRAAHVSMAPATAADIGRNAADFVFLREGLDAVPLAVAVSRQAGGLIRENFIIAIVYNILAVPLAVTGHVTPLIAALAMSGSSILVVSNAMRLLIGREMALAGEPALTPAPAHPEPGE